MAKITDKFLLIFLICLSFQSYSQDDYYSLELTYSGSVNHKLPNGFWFSSERTWNLEFNNDIITFEGVAYVMKDKDTLLRRYLTEMQFMMKNNNFLYNDYWLDIRDKPNESLYLDGSETIGKIIFGQETQIFNIISHYNYDTLHQDFFNCFFNIVFYLLYAEEVSGKIENISYWQLLEFEKKTTIVDTPFRKVSDSPLKYRFFTDSHGLRWDTAIKTISEIGKPVILEVADCFDIPYYCKDGLFGTKIPYLYFMEKSHITWHVYNEEMKNDLLKIGISNDLIKIIKHPKLNNRIPKEAESVFNFIFMNVDAVARGRSASLE